MINLHSFSSMKIENIEAPLIHKDKVVYSVGVLTSFFNLVSVLSSMLETVEMLQLVG